MKRTLYAAGAFLCGALAVGGVKAQSNIGGDLNWPNVPIIDETTVPAQPGAGEQQTAPGRAGNPPPSARAERPAPQSETGTADQPAVNRAPAQHAAPSAEREPRQRRQLAEPKHERSPKREAARPEPEPEPTPPVPVPDRPDRDAVATVPTAAAAVSLTPQTASPADDKQVNKIIGQMIMIGFEGVRPNENGPSTIAVRIGNGSIGGVTFAARNIESPTQLRQLAGAFRAVNSDPPPLIAITQEGGGDHGLSPEHGFHAYPTPNELGKGNDPLVAYSVYQRMAMELSYYGFNVNLAPDLDLSRADPSSAVPEAERSYGPLPKHVAAFAKAFRLAHADQGMLTVLKHFPGGLAAAKTDGASWETSYSEPYRQLVAGGNADIIMVGHAVHAELAEQSGLPASLSSKTIETVLRQEIGYQGVIICDDLEAPEIAGAYSLEDRIVRAIAAGSDVLLFGDRAAPPLDLADRVAAIVKNALAAGTLTRARLDASYGRIMALKQRLGGAGKAVAAKDEAARTTLAPAQ